MMTFFGVISVLVVVVMLGGGGVVCMFEDVHVHPLEARGQFPVSSTEIVSIIFETGSFLSLELISQALAKCKEPQ